MDMVEMKLEFPCTLFARLAKRAAKNGMTPEDYLSFLLTEKVGTTQDFSSTSAGCSHPQGDAGFSGGVRPSADKAEAPNGDAETARDA